MKNNIQELLSGITTTRESKYQEEVERQKQEIEGALVAFLKERKSQYESMHRANINHQTSNCLYFSFELDAYVLPEVAEFISAEFDLNVDTSKKNMVYGSFDV